MLPNFNIGNESHKNDLLSAGSRAGRLRLWRRDQQRCVHVISHQSQHSAFFFTIHYILSHKCLQTPYSHDQRHTSDNTQDIESETGNPQDYEDMAQITPSAEQSDAIAHIREWFTSFNFAILWLRLRWFERMIWYLYWLTSILNEKTFLYDDIYAEFDHSGQIAGEALSKSIQSLYTAALRDIDPFMRAFRALPAQLASRLSSTIYAVWHDNISSEEALLRYMATALAPIITDETGYLASGAKLIDGIFAAVLASQIDDHVRLGVKRE